MPGLGRTPPCQTEEEPESACTLSVATDGNLLPHEPCTSFSSCEIESKVVDLGNACWTYKQFTSDIQTRQYANTNYFLSDMSLIMINDVPSDTQKSMVALHISNYWHISHYND